MVRDTGISHSSKEDRVEPPQLVDTIRRHHLACSSVGFAAPVKLAPIELKAESARRCLEDSNAFRYHLFADSITGYYRDVEGLHTWVLHLACRTAGDYAADPTASCPLRPSSKARRGREYITELPPGMRSPSTKLRRRYIRNDESEEYEHTQLRCWW